MPITYSSDLYYTIALLLVTGGLIFMIDVKSYQTDGNKKEEKASRFLAWFNIVLAVSLSLASLVFTL
ncbi:CLC_0170 family protein [Paenibacillus thalictri]|uniref:Uncharacterized protein n=1 Tax=Paenibacillus thalictri TaxID=2527873 RepID=A0A4V2J4Z7_9BACL|nr:CLC_0170 family protein [Paenibacillus thalictri]TBL81842.1 hypothetical protein EYB31_02310 [Paenibacillus thalictri]